MARAIGLGLVCAVTPTGIALTSSQRDRSALDLRESLPALRLTKICRHSSHRALPARFFFTSILGCSWVAGCGAAQTSALPPASNDHGTFSLWVNREPRGSESFTIVKRGSQVHVSYQSMLDLGGATGKEQSRGDTVYASNWQPLTSTITAKNNLESRTMKLGGQPLALSTQTMPGGLIGTITSKRPPNISLADDSVVQFTAFCAIQRTGLLQVFPAVKAVVTEQAHQHNLRRYAIDLEGKGVVRALCVGAQLVGIEENTHNFSAIRVGAEAQVAAILALPVTGSTQPPSTPPPALPQATGSSRPAPVTTP